MKEIVILAGPNGAGKTTLARVLLPKFLEVNEYLNADEIARAISPGDVDAAALAAGRELISRMRGFIREGRSFALETTCSGKSYVPVLKACKEGGWRIALYYFWLPTPEASLERIAGRVRQGGTEYLRRLSTAGFVLAFGICSICTCHWRMKPRFTIIQTRSAS